MARRVEDDSAGDLHLPHRDLPPVPRVVILRPERQRQPVQPPLHEHVDRPGPEPVTDPLQRGRVIAGSEPVGQRGELEPGLVGLPLDPLVPVKPDLGRIGEPGADLNECRAEVPVPQVEVVAGHPPVSLVERPPRCPGRGLALRRGPHPLELLGHADRRHPGPAGARLAGQVRLHDLELGLVLIELDPRDVVGIGERDHRPAEPVPHLPEQRRRGEREPQVPGQERHHLGTGLQDRHVGVEIDPVQALDIQHHMPVQHVIDCYDSSHDDHLPQPLLVAMMRSPAPMRLPNHATRRSEAEPHCYDSSFCGFCILVQSQV
jgi:hypothetical protein